MDESEIRKQLTSKQFWTNIILYDRLDSTNLEAKRLVVKDAPEGTLLLAEEQTAGRGRLGRQWHSEPGQNLTFSLILRPAIPPEKLGVFSLYAGLSVAEAIAPFSPIPPLCKWPNDVLLTGKKVCGILSEAVFTGNQLDAVILGIGVNVNQTDFPEQLRSSATSLREVSGRTQERIPVLISILSMLEKRYQYLQPASLDRIISGWKHMSAMFGKPIQVRQNGVTMGGVASDIADDGSLILQTGGGQVKLSAGDVTLLQL